MSYKISSRFVAIKDLEEKVGAAAQTAVEVVRQAVEGEEQVQPAQA